MTVEIVEGIGEPGIPARDLRNGQIAVALGSSQIVQRYEGYLFMLGHGDAWKGRCVFEDDFRVRVLPNGTLLKIKDNE